MGAHEEVKPVLPVPIKATPYQHQIEAFNFACGLFGLIPGSRRESGGCALLMEMGTGKSLTSIAITGALAEAGRIRRVLVVAPLSILGVWEEEFQKFADFPMDQGEYERKYTGYCERYEAARKRLAEIGEFRLERNAKHTKIAMFLERLAESTELVTEFDEELWYATVDFVTVYEDMRMVFTFRDGNTVEIKKREWRAA